MRNENLDKKLPIDEKISELMIDEDNREYRLVDDKKIYQIEEKSQSDIDTNLAINRFRASGMTASEYLKSMSR